MRRLTLSLLAVSSLFFASCEKENKDQQDPDQHELPSSYNFDHVSYSGQTQRLDMLCEVVSYMKTANNGQAISATQLTDMFNNNGYTWNKSALNTSSKQLTNKIADGEGTTFGDWFTALENASQSNTQGSNGTAGLVSSNSGTKTYLFDQNGFEHGQLIEKAAMGAIFYYQATSVYMGGGKMNVDNENMQPGKGTKMQHHWDEAFGYWGVPTDFATDNFTYQNGAEYDRFWAKYANGRNDILNCNERLMNALIKGRDAINRKNYETRDKAISTARAVWEEICAATAIHYLNGARADFADDALRNHQLSEAYAFIYSLKFNPDQSATDQEIDDTLAVFDNLYEISVSDITTARDWLANNFDLNEHKEIL